jgi:tripartite-type tricarboxylate transporter receptor subunit TctC
MMDRRDFLAGCVGLSLAARASEAFGQSGPLTKIIFPFAAGGSGDTLCRLLAQHISQPLDRTIIVEDRTGADGLIGIKAVKGANPDGTTILVTTGPTMFLLPMVETKPSFDRDKDFMPVSLLTRFEFCVAIGPAVNAKDFAGLVAWLKANPAKASFGVPSNGTIPHFAGSRLEEILKIPLTRVAYRGTTPIINDLLGGHLPFAVITAADAIPQYRSGGYQDSCGEQ